MSQMYLQGDTQADIAETTGLSQPTISRILTELKVEWQQSALIDINEAKARELAKIDALELEYWAAWKRSQENAEVETTKMQGSDPAAPGKLEKQKRVEGQVGDPRYLQGIQWCIQRRCEIIGIDAPKKQEHTGKDGGPIETKQVDDERFNRAISTLADAIRESIPGEGAKKDGEVGATK